MKAQTSIFCFSAAVVLLSSCTLNQQLPAEPSAQQGSHERSDALQAEESTLLDEARNAEAQATASAAERAVMEAQRKALAEELARQEAEARYTAAQQAAREAQARVAAAEKARMEAEARMRKAEELAKLAQEKARERVITEAARKAALEVEGGDAARAPQGRRPQLFSSRGRRKVQVDAPAEVAPAAPTEKQQAAARKMLAQQDKKKEKARPAPVPTAAPVQEKVVVVHKPTPGISPETTPLPPAPSLAVAPAPPPARGALRGSLFTPSANDNEEEEDTPLPNSVELRGLRSPLMGRQLPMSIDGKLNKKK